MAARLLKLTAELGRIHAMFGDFAIADKNHRYIQVEAFAQFGIGIDVNLLQSAANFREQRRDL